jgi:hypothetical protein
MLQLTFAPKLLVLHTLTYSLTHLLTHSLTLTYIDAPTHLCTETLGFTHTHLLTYLLTYLLTHSLTHSLTNTGRNRLFNQKRTHHHWRRVPTQALIYWNQWLHCRHISYEWECIWYILTRSDVTQEEMLWATRYESLQWALGWWLADIEIQHYYCIHQPSRYVHVCGCVCVCVCV